MKYRYFYIIEIFLFALLVALIHGVSIRNYLHHLGPVFLDDVHIEGNMELNVDVYDSSEIEVEQMQNGIAVVELDSESRTVFIESGTVVTRATAENGKVTGDLWLSDTEYCRIRLPYEVFSEEDIIKAVTEEIEEEERNVVVGLVVEGIVIWLVIVLINTLVSLILYKKCGQKANKRYHNLLIIIGIALVLLAIPGRLALYCR